jgi:hypothetical protein
MLLSGALFADVHPRAPQHAHRALCFEAKGRGVHVAETLAEEAGTVAAGVEAVGVGRGGVTRARRLTDIVLCGIVLITQVAWIGTLAYLVARFL